ncbi:elongation factor G [candidate division KD3-62 bacterium DG_56]|uniref:Elongation factor G n=1 Tax=candidate division KD3-62 bacterium DG_56 TaxID=1704032 RepID=A0A0S7XQD2_9BACT|nr:MAG: elongation factor G [candidate division KD3-62 bacterium DG_56]
MKKYEAENIRNVALIGHMGAGKTSLCEAMLFTAGVVDRLGSVDGGTTVSDSDPDEIERKISLAVGLLPLEWRDHKINLIDAPGYSDFIGEVIGTLHVCDSCVLVVDAVAGVEVDAERYWAMADERGLGRLIVVNKLDKEHADFERTLTQIREQLGCRPTPLQIPIGEGTSFSGTIDLLRQKAITGTDTAVQEGNPPGDIADAVAKYREQMIEAAAEAEDSLTEKYLEEGGLSDQEVARGLRVAACGGQAVPVLCAAATRPSGARALLDATVSYLPSPADRDPVTGIHPETGAEESRPPSPDVPMATQIFKTAADPYAGRLTYFRTFSGSLHSDATVYNSVRRTRERVGQVYVPRGKAQEAVPAIPAGDIGVVAKLRESTTGETLCDESKPIVLPAIEFPEALLAVSIRAQSKADEDKLGNVLSRLLEEDRTLRVTHDPQTRETILAGMGDLHLSVALDRIQRKFGVAVERGEPAVAYRETIRGEASAQGKYKKQTGGRGQYGDVWVKVEPLERGVGFEFVDHIVGGVVPRNFIPAVEKGIREAMERGIVAGYPVVDLRVTLYDGSYHNVDSSDMAFKIAGSLAIQRAVGEARPALLEPIVSVEVTAPEQYMGDIMGSLNGKRGRILGMEPVRNNQVIRALVPQAEMFTYANELRSLTQGRASYTMQFSHYEEVPEHLAQRVIDEQRAAREKER